MIPLAEFLEKNVAWVERTALGSKDDLVPMLAWIDAAGPGGMMPLAMLDKDAEADHMRALLRRAGAVRYALIAAAWMVDLAPAEAALGKALIGAHGTGHPAYRQRRVEIYAVSVGERGSTLTAILKVARNNLTGRIAGLTRLPAGGEVVGRMTNLLGNPE